MDEGTIATASTITSNTASTPAEDDLRAQVQGTLRSLQRREPLPPTYKSLLQSGALTRRPAALSKHKFYKRIPSRLRERVETYSREIEGKDPFDRINQRQPIEPDKLSVALTMRAFKEHEQRPMLQATLAATAMHPERKRSLDGMALYLQKGMPKKIRSKSPVQSTATTVEALRDQAQIDLQKQQARQWEESRKRREAEEKKRREEALAEEKRRREREQELLEEEEAARAAAAPAVSREVKLMHLMISQGFQKLRDLDYPELKGLDPKPFELIIDRHNYQQLGLLDYFSYVSTPMNMQYIEKKKNQMKYTSFNEYFADVELMIDNALKYNYQETSPYHKAAVRLQKLHEKIKDRIWKGWAERKKKDSQK